MANIGSPSRLSLKRLAPLIALAAGLVLFFALGLNRYLSLDALAENRQRLLAWVSGHQLLAVPAYVLIYAAVVAFSLPGATVMTLSGGLLFGWLLGGAWAVIGATIGATLLFLAARTALGEPLRARAGPWLKKLEAGFADNAFSYMLVLRLVPVIPFFIVNLVPAFLGVKLSIFVITTFIGIIPGAMVYASIGNGLGSVLEAGGKPDLGLFTKPEIILPLVGLALLALVPVAYKRLKGRTP
jgi:uncharacterized membrane protein YdjX (TVP38/TMEM64 family)